MISNKTLQRKCHGGYHRMSNGKCNCSVVLDYINYFLFGMFLIPNLFSLAKTRRGVTDRNVTRKKYGIQPSQGSNPI